MYQEAFLKEHEKNLSYKQALVCKTKMFSSMKSQRTPLVPLFRLTDPIAQVKQQVDKTLDISGAVVVPEGHPEAVVNPGWGEEDVQTVFRPLLSSPKVPLVQEDQDELDLSDIEGLDPQVVELIQQKARDKAVRNRKHAKAALNTYDGLFRSVYRSLANFANATSDSVRIFLRLYSVTDFNQ